jgi:hypothetical protein
VPPKLIFGGIVIGQLNASLPICAVGSSNHSREGLTKKQRFQINIFAATVGLAG